MRWDNLRIDGEEEAQLPGYRDGAVVRRFDAPEALDIRFYEVRAKSALNRVPERSAMPFGWTINPYRGCTHACTYCVGPETPVLLADGRTRPIAELRVGDEIYGTERRGRHRRYVRTRVLDHWATVKPGFRISLEDGTELIASGDHRFLTSRGWKHVRGTEYGAGRRPRLTVGSELVGTGRFAEPPLRSSDYRRGYLCGLIRGDGHVGSHSSDRPGRANGDVHGSRLALTDPEALHRSQAYLRAEGVERREFVLHAATATTRSATATRTQARISVDPVRKLIRWPLSSTSTWRRGFLAGIFDAEGSGDGVLRISSCDSTLLAWTEDCLARFGFETVLEATGRSSGPCVIRVRGGPRERLRFFHAFDPAIHRKLDIDGMALESDARTGVLAVEPVGRAMQLYDITTGTGDFIADGVVSHNCFARPTHTYLGFDAGRGFEREIVVKVNAPELLRAELARPSWQGEHVAMGTNTDPYQWVESKYRLMPPIWEAMRDARNPCSILTKSPLVLRDLARLREIAAVTDISANLSIPTLDPKAWRATEPHTPHPRARLEAVAELNRAGIPTGVLVAPLMPGVNDAPDQVEPILEAAAAAGATGIGGIALHLRGDVREIFFAWLRSERPDLVERYERLYARGAYALPEERARLARLVRGPGAPPPSRFRGRDPAPPGRQGGARERGGADRPGRRPASSGDVQEALF